MKISREAIDALVGTGRRPVAVLITLPDQDHPDVIVRGVTRVDRSGGDLYVSASVLVLRGDDYVEHGRGGGIVVPDTFMSQMTIEGSPLPLDEDETEWLIPSIETSVAATGEVMSRVVARPADASDGL